MDVEPLDYAGVGGVIGSPPCQSFSRAGKGEGRRALDNVLAAMNALQEDPSTDHWASVPVTDERTKLVLEPLRWTLLLRPRWTLWEQVFTVLPVWEAGAEVLRDAGYSVVTANVTAETYGVPQTRRRSILLARRDGYEARLPAETHTKYRQKGPREDEAGVLKPWVSMADALGWGDPLETGAGQRPDRHALRCVLADQAAQHHGRGARAGPAPRRGSEPVQRSDEVTQRRREDRAARRCDLAEFPG